MEVPSETYPSTLQIFVKLLDGKTKTLNFPSPQIPISAVKHRLFQITQIPTHLQILTLGPRQLHENSFISNPTSTIHLLLPLRGGKGGFGSLLRGAATKAGQKKTNNFDACRDMSGRRLRHVNAEKRLEEWKKEEEERKLERMAEEFLKKKAKTGKKGVGDGEAEKYVDQYREESARCVADVEQSVRDAIMGDKGKRKKGNSVEGADAKRLKIWMGKRKVADSDSDSSDNDSSDDKDEEREKSIVLNNGNSSDSNKELEESSDSVARGKHGKDFIENSSEEEKETLVQVNLSSSEENAHVEENGVTGSLFHEENTMKSANSTCFKAAPFSGTEAVKSENECRGSQSGNPKEIVGQQPSVLSSGDGEANETSPSDADTNVSSGSRSSASEETIATSSTVREEPLNFDDFNSAAEMEVLGMDSLKAKLQAHGLKCGGTLQERAARLFLLKSTPLDKIPKKLLAKK